MLSSPIHLKLDELIKGTKGARTGLVDLEDLSDEELEKLQKEFERLREQTNGKLGKTSSKKNRSGAR